MSVASTFHAPRATLAIDIACTSSGRPGGSTAPPGRRPIAGGRRPNQASSNHLSHARSNRCRSSGKSKSDAITSEDELRELAKLMPDPDSDIFEPSVGPITGLDFMEESEFADDPFIMEMMDQALAEMSQPAGTNEEMAGDVAGGIPTKEYNPDDFVGTAEQIKHARDCANFHAKARWKNGVVGSAIRDAVQLNALNMQRAENRYKMTKEMGRWVDFLDKQNHEAGTEVRTVPSWVKAAHLINWDFEDLNETHRLEDIDDDEEQDDDEDDDDEEVGDDEDGDGLLARTLEWELPKIEIAGKPHLTQNPKAAMLEAHRIAEEAMGDNQNKFAFGYMRKGTVDVDIVTEWLDAVEEDKQKTTAEEEEEEITPEDQEMLISAKDAPKMTTYLSPEDAKQDESMALLWQVVVPGQGPPETAIMGDILGGVADNTETQEELFDAELFDGDFDDDLGEKMEDLWFDDLDDEKP
eukprot:CAMPEP_0117651202 /NCGR_PEP_ID=MMETSP0804-20121206/1964_1 /TAXON_ID=1074897 /ORGANISM="Tetraselmis astigmatica, Strain CCMP880" /LENGTH=466 /DNA_ID=CAMNT_0005457159 /DNA_START=246 /DNA_END=1646 /DNA_ORIENTATION=-